jgi:1-acyl-sn-glycerol-3-phosphate acyltransferase
MKRWHYETARDLDQTPLERLRQFPREPDLLVYGVRLLAAALIRVGLRFYHRLEIIGREQLPPDRAIVLVANHASHLDTVCLLAALPLKKLHQAYPAAAADYFFESVARTWIAAVIVNALPFGRERRARQSLSTCTRLLAERETVLIIFPEGTRTTTGEMQEFKSGIGALVAGRDVGVFPCFLEGTFRAWPKGSRLPRPRKVRLLIGEERNYAARSTEKWSLSSIANELQEAVNELARKQNGTD